MAALTKARLVPAKGGSAGPVRRLPVAAATTLYSGALVMLDASGDAVPAAAAGTNNALVIAGIAEETVDNGGGAAGDLTVRVRATGDRDFLGFQNHGVDAVTAADVGQLAHASDDQTVANAADGTTRPLVGHIHSVDEDGLVYVTVPGRALG